MHWVILAMGLVSMGMRAGLYLIQMWWEAVRERRRGQSLAVLTSQLTDGGWLEEIRADGSEFRVSLGRRETARTAQDERT